MSQFAQVSPPDLSLPQGVAVASRKRNLTVERNRSFTFEAAIEDADGAAQDITGWQFRWVAEEAITDETPVFTKTLGDGITITNAAGGIVRFHLPPAFTASLSLGPLAYFIEAQTDANETQTILFGTLTVVEEGTSEN